MTLATLAVVGWGVVRTEDRGSSSPLPAAMAAAPTQALAVASPAALETDGEAPTEAPSDEQVVPSPTEADSSSVIAPDEALAADGSSPAPVDPAVAHELRLLEFAAVRAAERRGLSPSGATAGARTSPGSVSADETAQGTDDVRRRAVSDELLVEYLVRLRRLPDVFPNGTSSAPVRAIARSVSKQSVESAPPAARLRLLQLALQALD
jgi:hypothetical protein